MASLITPANIFEIVDAVVNGPDSLCDQCGRDLYAGIDEWHRLTTDDGSGGDGALYIQCERCLEMEYEAWLDMVDEAGQ